jgi:hypothetical protein
MRAGIAAQPDRFLVDAAKLLLRNIAVIALELLLGAQLYAVIGEFALTALTVLASWRLVIASSDLALRDGEEPRPPLSRLLLGPTGFGRSAGLNRGSRNAPRA